MDNNLTVQFKIPVDEVPLENPSDRALGEVEKTIDAIVASESVLPAIRLSLYNFFIKNPTYTTAELDKEIHLLSELSVKEEIYKSKIKIPTVGTEVEFPIEWANTDREKMSILNRLGIRNIDVTANLWEVSQRFTYSPNAQSKILLELQSMGIINLVNSPNLSLHINLGTPNFLNNEADLGNNSSDTLILAHSSTIAFASTDRLKKRKTETVFKHKNDSIEPSERGNSFRLELRTTELNDNSTYRAINEIQLMSAAYFAAIKKLKDLPIDSLDNALCEIWNSFKTEFDSLVDEFPDLRDDLIREKTQYIISRDILDMNPEISKRMRIIFSKYSRKVKSILF